MKNVILLIFTFLPFILLGQIKGNKKIVTQIISIVNVTAIEIGLYAKVEIDCSANEYLNITTDKNLFNHIEKSVSNGVLKLDQIKWIQPSTSIVIKIGAPELVKISQSTHDKTLIKNIDKKTFSIYANVGKIQLSGKVDQLVVITKLGNVNARQLEMQKANVNIYGAGRLNVNQVNEIKGFIDENGTIIYEGNKPLINLSDNSKGNVISKFSYQKERYTLIKNISFKIKNNSLKKIDCYVIGDNNNGSKFSYGFPLHAGQVRKKNWSVGSKIYEINESGSKKLLKEINAEDEGKTLKLF